MRNPHRKRRLVVLALDIAMIWMEIHALGISLGESEEKMFRYYTQDSNLLSLIVCIICGIYGLIKLRRGARLPMWVQWLRYMTACCLTFTLVMAGTLLVAVEPERTFYNFMLEGKYLYLHTICPLVVIVQFFLCRDWAYGEKHALLAMIPTVIYCAISLVMNARGAYTGPYPFLEVLEQPGYVTVVGCIAVLGINYTGARLLALSTARRRRKARY